MQNNEEAFNKLQGIIHDSASRMAAIAGILEIPLPDVRISPEVGVLFGSRQLETMKMEYDLAKENQSTIFEEFSPFSNLMQGRLFPEVEQWIADALGVAEAFHETVAILSFVAETESFSQALKMFSKAGEDEKTKKQLWVYINNSIRMLAKFTIMHNYLPDKDLLRHCKFQRMDYIIFLCTGIMTEKLGAITRRARGTKYERRTTEIFDALTPIAFARFHNSIHAITSDVARRYCDGEITLPPKHNN